MVTGAVLEVVELVEVQYVELQQIFCFQNAAVSLVLLTVVERAVELQIVHCSAGAVYECAERVFVQYVDSSQLDQQPVAQDFVVEHSDSHLCFQFVLPLQAKRELLQICQ